MNLCLLTEAMVELYGHVCEQLIKDFEDLKVVNQQLDNM